MENVNYLNDKAEQCTFRGHHKNAFCFKGHNAAKMHSIKKPVPYAQGLEQLKPRSHLNRRPAGVPDF